MNTFRSLRCALLAVLIGIATLCGGDPARAQNTICPTAANGDSTNKCASTQFIQNAFAGGSSLALQSAYIFIGNASNIATPRLISGDGTFSNLGVLTITQSAGGFTVNGALSVTGGAVGGSPTGGNKGAGTVNLANDFYKNGTIIPETVSAPLTLSAAGLLACPSCVLISGTAHGDSAYSILSTDRYVYTNAAFTAARTWTLPAANSLSAGTTIWVQDAQGTVTTTNTLTIQRAGADTIDVGSTSFVISGAGGGITFTTDGISNWGLPIQTPSTGGTGQKTLTNHGLLVGAGVNPITQLGVATTGQLLFGVTGADPAFASTGTGVPTALGISVGSAGAFVTFNGALGSPSSAGTMPSFTNGGTITGGGHVAINNLGIRDTSAAFDVTLATTSSTALTAGRTITYDVVNGNRSFKLGSNLTIASDPGAVGGAVRANTAGTFTQAACADLSNGTANCSAAVGQLPGEPSTGSASTGNVGEYVSSSIASGSAVPLLTATPKNLTNISLTAGDWDVYTTIDTTAVGSPVLLWLIGSISQTTNTLDATPGSESINIYGGSGTAISVGGAFPTMSVGPVRVSLSGTTTIYSVVDASFSGGTSLSVYGILRARRVR